MIVWADGGTEFKGHIEAQGGEKGGNGGFVETSGKEKLTATGDVIAQGKAKGSHSGTWLLDPRNVTITSATAGGTFSGGNPNIFTPTANSSTVLNTTINSALESGTTVIITTNDSDGNVTQKGDITLSANITKSSGANDAGLILRAANTIKNTGTRRIEVTGGTGKLNVKLNSDSDNSGAGAINLANTTVITNGGNFSAGGGNAASNGQTSGQWDNAAMALTDSAYGVSGNEMGVSINDSTVSTNQGNVSVVGHGYDSSSGSNTWGVRVNNSIINTSSGNISIYGNGGAGGGENDGLLIYDGVSQLTSTDGNILLHGVTQQNGGDDEGIETASNSGTHIISTVNGNIDIYALINNPSPGSGDFDQSRMDVTSTNGNITITSNRIVDNNGSYSNFQAGGNIVIRPVASNTSIGLGNGATGILNLDTNALGYFSAGGLFEIGDRANGSGAVDLRAWDWSGKSHNVLITGGALTVNGAQTTAPNKNLTLLSRNTQDITLNNTISSASGSGQVNLLASQHIRANASVQHAGTGQVNAVAGWDGTHGLNADGSITIGTIIGTGSYYGNSSGSIFVNNGAGTQGVALGSKDGATTVAGYNATLAAPNVASAYAQLGYVTAASTGTLNIKTANDLTLRGGGNNGAYAMIGNGGFDRDFNLSGNIDVASVGDVSLAGGTASNTFATIGNGGQFSDGLKGGNITLSSNTLTIQGGDGFDSGAHLGNNSREGSGTVSGNITVNTTNSIQLTGSTGPNTDSYAQIGHGGWSPSSYDSSGNLSINAGNIFIQGGSAYWSYAQIGQGGETTQGNRSGTISITTAGDVTLQGSATANDGKNYAMIGHGAGDGVGVTGNRSGNILMNVGGELSLVDSGTNAYLGHVTTTASGLSNANIRVVANSLDFAAGPNSGTFDLNNVNFSNRMGSNLAGGDVTIVSTNAPIIVNNGINGSSTTGHNLNILSYSDITLHDNIGVYGSDDHINLVAGWDGIHGLNPIDGSVDFSTLRLRDATDTGDLIINSGTNLFTNATSGTGIIAAAAGSFINNNAGGGGLVNFGPGSRYVIYSTSNAGTTLGLLTPSSQGGGYALHQPLGLPAGDQIVYDSNGLLTLLVNGQTYTYNGSAQLVTSAGAAGYGTYYALDAASLTSLTGAGYTLGNFTGSLSGNATFAAADSTHATTGTDITGNVNTLLSSLGYDLSFNNAPTNELVIGKKAITAITGLTGVNRAYDGTTLATLNTGGAGFTGIVGGDTLNAAGYTAAFTDPTAGVAKTINVTGLSLGGASVANYNLIGTTATTTADITALPSAGNGALPSAPAPQPVLPPLVQAPVIPLAIPSTPLSQPPVAPIPAPVTSGTNGNNATLPALPLLPVRLIPATVQYVSQNGFPALPSVEVGRSESTTTVKPERSGEDRYLIAETPDAPATAPDLPKEKPVEIVGKLITVHPALVKLFGISSAVSNEF